MSREVQVGGGGGGKGALGGHWKTKGTMSSKQCFMETYIGLLEPLKVLETLIKQLYMRTFVTELYLST